MKNLVSLLTDVIARDQVVYPDDIKPGTDLKTCEMKDGALAARARAELERLSDPWRPISEAKKDATEYLLRVPYPDQTRWGKFQGYRRVVGHWAEGDGSEQPAFSGWFFDTGHGFAEISPQPTHFMDLPPQ